MGVPLDVDVARCLYAGLVTDTVGFRTAGEAAHLLAAELVAAGVEPATLVRPLLRHPPLRLVRRTGPRPRRLRAGAGGRRWAGARPHRRARRRRRPLPRRPSIDSVVDTVRTAAEAEVALVLKQVGERRWSASLRSKGAVDVSRVAARLGGGGHQAAAGFTRDGTVGQVLSEVRSALAAHARPLAS